MTRRSRWSWIVGALLALAVATGSANARTVYRCVVNGTVSLATAPEPGSHCVARKLADDDPNTPNLWGAMGVINGALYQREQDGKTVYSTRKLPGSVKVMNFTVATPAGSPAHLGLGQVGKPRLDLFDKPFRQAAKRTGVDDAYLRAIAHAESYFDPKAISDKGAEGVMQLLPEVASEYGVGDPFDATQSIRGGAKLLKGLLATYHGDYLLAAAAYNAGAGAVAQYSGVPPYAETRAYVAKVQALHARYRIAMGRPVPPGSERPAISDDP